MAWPTSLQIALKEWSSVCRALETGRQTILLRKGGIYESSGEFEVENRQFLLFPTYVHQKREMLKEAEHATLETMPEEPREVTVSAACVVTDILRLTGRAQMNALDDEHVWAPPLIDMRFNYKPENPLYLLIVRTYRLHASQIMANTPAYAGCKSWVPLDQPVELGDPLAVMDDVKFEFRRKAILEKLRAASPADAAAQPAQ
jgi:hypothetical protein